MKRELISALLCCAALAGCGGGWLPAYYDRLDYRIASGVSRDAGAVTGFYVTDRQYRGPGVAEAYDARRDEGAMGYGTCRVTLPRDHAIGSDVVTEQLARALGRPGPGHLQVESTSPSAAGAFFAALSAAAAGPGGASGGGDVLVLVHGYNSSFAGPVARAAELAHDLGGTIVPVAYCWSSQGEPQGYPHDENDVDFAARQLATFLARLRSELPAARLHLVAHSMGARVATLALARLRGPFARRPLQNVVFAAPDIDAAEFKARMVDDGLTRLAERTTLYAAWNDRALQASEVLHGRDYPRAGRAGPAILVVDGIDTVDVSLNDASVVGHGYYGDNRAVIGDLFLLLVHDAPPERRNLYRATAERTGMNFWLVRR